MVAYTRQETDLPPVFLFILFFSTYREKRSGVKYIWVMYVAEQKHTRR